MKHMVVSLFLALAVVGCGDSSDGGDKGGGGDKDNNAQHGGGLCSASNACPSGQFCFNGLCAIGCQSNANCAADQYCDTSDGGGVSYCKNKVVPTCTSDSQCQSNQFCMEGLCSLKPPEAPASCTVDTNTFNDGCDKYSVCTDPDDEGSKKPYCASFPACPADGVCPTGLAGSVCNDGFIPAKGRFCMPGVCKTDANCPSKWSCVKFVANQVLGMCSMGSTGFPCMNNDQCLSKQCMQGMPNMPGVCM
ncbi:hypothetical protein JGU66_05600 [Myxococcaceae bacterium JPH2]|nr:hypothetical protein [Myxococcaceae bacterium JPH2]